MTKAEGQQRYAQLALKLGDLTVKGWVLEAQVKEIKAELSALDIAMNETKETK